MAAICVPSVPGKTEGERSEWSHPEVERSGWKSLPQGEKKKD